MADIEGLWKITEMNAMDMNFRQTWKSVADLDSDPDVPAMQKVMAKALYLFRKDGTFLQLMRKEFDEDGEFEKYNDDLVIGKTGGWKEEDGKMFIAGEENGEPEWSEIVPSGDGLEIFGFFRISRAD